MIQREVLPNGLRIVTETITHVQSIALGIWVGVGSRDEPIEQRGISHVIEHMLFKGTPTRTAQQIADQMDMIGGDINAFTSKESTCYHVRILSEFLPLAVDVLSDMVLNSVIDPEELEREQNVILEEIKRRDDEPEDLIHDVFTESLWPAHPLGLSVIGTPETVAALKQKDLKSYMSRYTPDTIVVTATGNLNHQELVAMISERFGHLTGSVADWRLPNTRPIFTPATVYIEKPVEQVNVVMGVNAYSQHDEKRYPLSVLDTVFGGSMSSRLFQEIREKRGLAYSVGSYTQLHDEGGYFAIYSGTGAETAAQVLELATIECRKVRDEGITETELQRAKNQFRGGIVMGQESMNSRMMRLGRSELVFGRVVPIDEILNKINAVTQESVLEVAHHLFDDEKFAVATVGPAPKKSRRKKTSTETK